MTPTTRQQRFRSRTARTAGAVVAGIVLPALVVTTMTLSGGLSGGVAHAAEWGIVRWGTDLIRAEPPKPADDLPPIGTILPRTSSDGSASAPRGARAPEASILAVPEIRAAQELQASLTDAQKAAIAEVAGRYSAQMKAALDRLPRPSVDAPKDNLSKDEIASRASLKQPDPSAVMAASSSIRSVSAAMNDDIRKLLTPEQRALFDKSVPDVSRLDSVPLPSTAKLSPASTGDETGNTARSAGGKDDSDKEVRQTKTEKQQHERTNNAGLDEYHTEGNIVALRCAADQPVPDALKGPVSFDVNETPYAVLATRDGLQQVRLLNDTSSECGHLKAGDYLSVDGVKQHEFLFDAEELSSQPAVLR